MKQLVLSALLMLAPTNAHAYHTGSTFNAPGGAGGGGGLFYTGSPRDRGWTCAACHVDPPGDLRVAIEAEPSLFAEGAYVPSQRYQITVRMIEERLGVASTRSNFNAMALTVVNEDGAATGQISAGDGFFVRGTSTLASDSRDVGVLEWTFAWTAPEPGDGNITFHLAVVDGNGAESPPTVTRTDPFGDDLAVAAVRLVEAGAQRARASPRRRGEHREELVARSAGRDASAHRVGLSDHTCRNEIEAVVAVEISDPEEERDGGVGEIEGLILGKTSGAVTEVDHWPRAGELGEDLEVAVGDEELAPRRSGGRGSHLARASACRRVAAVDHDDVEPLGSVHVRHDELSGVADGGTIEHRPSGVEVARTCTPPRALAGFGADDAVRSRGGGGGSGVALRVRMRAICSALLTLMCPGCYFAHGLGDEVVGIDAGSGRSRDAGRDAPMLDAGSDAAVSSLCTLVPEGELLVAQDDDGDLDAPDIFWTGERVGVVLHQSNAGGFEHGIVALGSVDPALSEAAPLRTIGPESHGWGEATWNGEGFGFCWSGDLGGEYATRFREVRGLDGRPGPPTSFGMGTEACLDLVFGHGRYAITWRNVHRETETVVDSLVQVIERDGTRIGEPINMGTTAYVGYTPNLHVTDTGFVAISDNEDVVRVVRFDRDGVTTSDSSIPLPGAGYTASALRGDQIGLATLSGERETRSLTFRVVGPDLREVFTRVIADGAPNASRPRVLARPEGWLLVWGEGSRPSYRAMMLSLDEHGRPLAPRRVLYRGQHSGYGGPSLLSVDDTVFIGISHQLEGTPEYGREYTHVQRWRCAGAQEDLCRPQDAFVDGDGDCERGVLLGWRFDGSACVPLYDCDSGCLGADCDRVTESRFACESDRRECLAPRRCEPAHSPANEVCGPLEIPSARPEFLHVFYGGDDPCPCERPTCELTPSGPLELTATLSYCPDEVPDCDCFDPEPSRPFVSCPLPPLAPGTWTIRFDGREPITLVSERGGVEPSGECR